MDGGVISPTDQQTLVSSFLDIAVGQTADTARQFLQATSWKLEEAIHLFFVGHESGASGSSYFPPFENERPLPDQNLGESKKHLGNENTRQNDDNEVRAPLPVKREVLYDTPMLYGPSRLGYQPQEARTVVPFRNFDEEPKRAGIWESEQGATSTADNSRDNLASLYRPPFALMHHGPFEKAKDAAKDQNKWLLVNLQSNKEFSSHMLNRDTWANEAVSQTIISNFIFWQVSDDTEEGSKVSTYYRLDSLPVILVIDPITGQKIRLWRGMVQPESLLEDLLPFLDGTPKDHQFNLLSHKRPRENSQASAPKIQDGTTEEDEEMQLALAASMEGMIDTGGVSSKDGEATSAEEEIPKNDKPTYPPLPEEPKADRNLLCRVGVRLPDGRRLQRSFFRTDPIQLLWSFCYTHLDQADPRSFRLTQAIPGASKDLDYDTKLTFQESGLSNSMISVTWE